MFATALYSSQQEPFQVPTMKGGWVLRASLHLHPSAVLLRSAVTVYGKKWHFQLQLVAVLGQGFLRSPGTGQNLPCPFTFPKGQDFSALLPLFTGSPCSVGYLTCRLHVKCIFTLSIFKQRSIQANLILCSTAGVLVISQNKK